ncbi:adhesin [Atopomonas sediminilitoris]|uniref:adhesin n=1 Tax=Atopomonas sediminilitoris TaxID=2919919 RepID=UPI001F4DEF41|nr:adhesin [Atopomonas sediminilitoris]MCJ8167754.1 adhesin [Atopomonas sediminilitoris]
MNKRLCSTSLLAALLWPALASAEEIAINDQALIHNSGQFNSGLVSINQAAGEHNQQSNQRVIQQGGSAGPSAQLNQFNSNAISNTARQASAEIEGAAFANSAGVLSVNQSAGAANQQANLFVLHCAETALNDQELASASALTQVNTSSPALEGDYRVALDEQAFVNSRGVVQLNQSAGVGNRTANTISIRVLEGL